jgi:hypothetical protein
MPRRSRSSRNLAPNEQSCDSMVGSGTGFCVGNFVVIKSTRARSIGCAKTFSLLIPPPQLTPNQVFLHSLLSVAIGFAPLMLFRICQPEKNKTLLEPAPGKRPDCAKPRFLGQSGLICTDELVYFKLFSGAAIT